MNFSPPPALPHKGGGSEIVESAGISECEDALAITDINSEDRLVQQTFAEHLEKVLGWDSVYAFNSETFGPQGTLGRASEREAVLSRDLRAALSRLNPGMPEPAREQALERLTRIDPSRSLVQHNREYYRFIRDGVPVEWRDATGQVRRERARVIDFRNGMGPDGAPNNRFLAVRGDLSSRACGYPITIGART